jgi:carboxymethylenebutenolidase
VYRTRTVDVAGSSMPILVFDPPGPGPHPGLVIAQHLPVAHTGLENDIYQITVGERYAAAGYACAMPWVFHWWPPDTDIEVKRAQFRDDHTVADLAATFELLAARDDVDADRIGILGHCWGGRIAWLGASHEPRYRACAVFYGGRIHLEFAGCAPAPITRAGEIRCPVLGLFGNEDAGPSPADVDAYEAALKAAGVPYEFHRYDGAGHGFQTFTSAERYRPAQSEDAWAKAMAFFAAHLR